MKGYVIELFDEEEKSTGYIGLNEAGVVSNVPIPDMAVFFKSRSDARQLQAQWITQFGGDAELKPALMSVKLGE